MPLAKLLILCGLLLVALGVCLMILTKLHLPLGRLPGDITWRGRNTTVYFPWVTCLVLSLLGTLLLWLFSGRR